jgi:hypothetical protein
VPGIVLKPAFFGPRQHFGEFDANATADPDGEDFTYAWDFGDGSAPVTSSLKVHHAYAAGHFQLSFTATDEAGVSATSTIGIEVMNTYVPPTVNTADTTAPTRESQCRAEAEQGRAQAVEEGGQAQDCGGRSGD